MTDEKTPEQLHDEAVARGELPSDDDLRAIAQGRRPKPWRQTFTHPIHGELTFEMELPDAAAMTRHSIEMDNLLGDLDAPARGATMLMVAAIAGFKSGLITAPVVARIPEETGLDEDDHTRVREVHYDPDRELDEGWLCDVWARASLWRQAFIAPGALDRLGKDSEPTPGSGSDTPSAEASASPSTTPA